MRLSAFTLAAVLVIGGLGVIAAAPPGDPALASGRVRVGTYDSRAIAVAYAASSFSPVGEKMKEYDAAKQAGDKGKMAELESWGKSYQRMLHFQGFGRVPVGDLLEPVKDGVAQVAADHQLAIIAMQCDYVGADAEVVDVTDDLVELFSPAARTREMARKVQEADPVSLTVLADMPAEQ